MYRILFSLCLLSLLIITSVMYFTHKNKPIDAPHLRCALIAPAAHPAIDEINEGFTKTIQQSVPNAHFITYNAQGNKTVLHTQIEKAIQSNVNIIMTIGATASQLTHALLIKRNITSLTHIFTAVDDPVGKQLVPSLEKADTFTTGVISTVDFEQQIKKLVMVKPSAQNIMLLYDPSHPSNAKDKETIKAICSQMKLIYSDMAIMHTNEIAQKVPLIAHSIDTIIILKDHLLVTAIDVLVKLCNQYHLTLYCSDLNSGQKGAALAFGILEYEYGSYAAQLALNSIQHAQNTILPPVYVIKKNHFQINTHTAATQGIPLHQSMIDSLKHENTLIL